MDLPERIEMNAEGHPQIAGKHMTVKQVISLLSDGWTKNEVLTKHPNLSIDDIRACFKYVGGLLDEKHG